MKDNVIGKPLTSGGPKKTEQASQKKHLSFAVCGDNIPEIPEIAEVKTTKHWVSYGKNNLLPAYLWDLYLRSALLQSIINGTTDYTIGNGIQSTKLDPKAEINTKGDTLEDVIKKAVNDYLIFDGFALQIIYNKLGEVGELYWLDFRNCRTNEDENVVYYSKEWQKSSPKYVEYKRFDGKQKSGSCVFYFKGHRTRGVYPIPRYSGALNALETSTEIARYHLSAIHNNFNGNLIINFNNGEPTDDVKKEIERKIKNKFSGADNGGKFLVSFNDSKENGVEVVRLQDDNTDKKYEQLRKDTYKEVFIAFRCQPQLFGFVIEGSLFNKEEYQQAYELYYKTVVVPIQDDFIRCFNKIYNSDVDVITFDPFVVEQPEENEKTEE